MTRYLDRMIAGDAPTADEWNDHLVAFHRTYGGVTAKLMAFMRNAKGETSYDVLARRIRDLAPHARAVIDVGCGDGAFLGMLDGAFGGKLELHGIDLCDTEIARARRRLPEATFVCADASRTDIGEHAYDVASAHLSLMSFAETAALSRRLHRALHPSGLLAVVAEDPLAGDAIIGLMGSVVTRLRENAPNFAPRVPGRERIEHDDVLRAVLAGAGFTGVSIERFRVHAKLSTEQLWSFVERTYPLGLLDEHLRADLRKAVDAEVNAVARSDAALALRLVTARA